MKNALIVIDIQNDYWGPLGKRKLSYAKPVFCTYYYSLSVMRGIYPVPV